MIKTFDVPFGYTFPNKSKMNIKQGTLRVSRKAGVFR